MNYMNGSQPSLELILRNYASHVFGSTILLGIAVLVAFHNPIARKISAGLQRRLLVARTPITDGRGSKSETLNDHTAAQRLHSLVIGIDAYPSLAPLRGAVNDASDVATYLMSDLGVPANQVAVLCNEEATRKRIIQEFQALANNPNIENGDPILIYYAGHGGLTEASVEWKGTHGAKQIQVIFPFDYLLKDPESAEPVNCIPDKTMGGLLNELSSNKGDNITVIFDSCHSASGTRANSQKGTDLNRRERSADVKVEIPPNIDSDLFAPDRPESHLPEKKHRDAELLLYTDQTSHIHLAACGPRQKAIEENGRGVFTAALLKKLRESRVDNITYHNLLKSLEMSCEDQSPQCYGKHKNRIIFNSRVSSSNKTFVPVDFEDGEFILAAGEASGVTLGSIWELHQSPTEDSPSVGQFTISELYGSVAILEPTRSISNLPEGDHNRQLYARCVHVGPGNELRVWISPDDRKFLFQDREQVGGAHDSGVGYVFTPTREAADVALEIHHQGTVVDMTGATQAEVIFYWCDDIAAKYGASKLKQRKPARREEVEIVLFAAAKWRWHLRRGNSRGRMVDQEVVVNMLKVANRVDRRRTYLHTPEPAPMNADGVVDIFVEKSALYGFRLESRISQPLYVRMFYFDATDFSISDMFGHNTAKGESTPNVAPRGRLLIGSGTDGGTPVKFNISPGSKIELGYMKVFWSTEPLELDHMGQISAFKMKAGDMRGADVDRDSTDSEWGTVCLPVVLRQ